MSNLKIWDLPKETVVLKGIEYYVRNRYATAGDIGGVSKGADFSDLIVLDRYRMLFGGPVMPVAEWHGHLDQDLFAWLCAQISHIYGKALFGLETNSLRKDKKDGDHFLTILDTIKDHYDNIYIRNQFDAADKDWLPKYGFHTNTSSKDMVLSALRAGIRDGKYLERNIDGYEELGYYERKDDGTLGAIAGKHDDRVMVRAIGYWMATSPMAMDSVQLVPVERIRSKNKRPNSPMGII